MKKFKKKGFAVLTVIFIVIVFSVLGMASVSLLSGAAERMSDEYHSQQAFNVAEAGVAYAVKQLAADADWSDNVGYVKGFGPGAFTISFSDQSADSATVLSTGTVQGIVRSMSQEVTQTGSGSLAFSSAIYTEQDINASGQAHMNVSGDVVSGGEVRGSGQARVDIAGDLATLDGVSTSGQSHVGVSGESSDGYEDAQIPTPDWDYWQSHADHIIEGNVNHGGQGTYTYNGIY